MLKIDITFFRLLFALACVGFVSLVASVLFLASAFHYWLKHEQKLRQARYNETQQLINAINQEYRSTGRF